MELYLWYSALLALPSDMQSHLPHLRRWARECGSVVEIGLRNMISTTALLLGLSENGKKSSSYIGIDLQSPPQPTLKQAQDICIKKHINFQFLQQNDLTLSPLKTDFLFIDSLHTYCHLTWELEHFAPSVSNYIALHDTSEPWSYTDDLDYKGNYSEYPIGINRIKKGIWPAVTDFLERHPEWRIQERHLASPGLTLLSRVIPASSNRRQSHRSREGAP